MEKPEEKTNRKSEEKNTLSVVIRISGMVKVRQEIEDTLDRLKLRRKYSAILINPKNRSLNGLLKKVKYYTAYGIINKETLAKLIKSRAKSAEGNKRELKVKPEEVAEGLLRGKILEDFGLKSFFRLHPPRGGIKSKLQYPKGVLGDNKEDINKLVEGML
jgi:large subunit ribosomal protein L30